VYYYLYGRDAVAAKAIGDVADAVLREEPTSEEGKERNEAELFWCIAGLIESHQLEKAEALLRTFIPKDFRLLMALNMGAFCVERLHVTSADEKKIASRITSRLGPMVQFMRADVMRELKGLLLEVRKGSVMVLDDGANEDGAKENGALGGGGGVL
jgi:hypothetical protein